MCGHRLNCWKTIPISGRTFLAAPRTSGDGLACDTVVPSITMRPSDGASSKAMHRSSVVLPEPLGPMMQVDCPVPSARSTLFRTVWRPKRLTTASAASTGPAPERNACLCPCQQTLWVALASIHNKV